MTTSAEAALKNLEAIHAARLRKPEPGTPAAEARRIVDMPIVASLSKDDLETFCRHEILAPAFNGGFRLFAPQAEAVLAYDMGSRGPNSVARKSGLFAPIAVGFGKTLTIIMIANRALRKPTVKRVLLFLPPNTYDQFMDRDLAWARKRVDVSMRVVGLGGRDQAARKKIAGNKAFQGLFVVPYSLLSTTDTSEILEAIAPDLVIADEAHNLKNFGSARTKRVMRLLAKFDPEFVALSGTMASKSIMDFHHLLVAALRDRAPIPLKGSMAKDWGIVLDAEGAGDQAPDSIIAQIRPLVLWAQDAQRKGYVPETHNTEDYQKPIGFDSSGFRRAWHLRLVSAEGVVATSDVEIGVSLSFQNTPAKDGPDEVVVDPKIMAALAGRDSSLDLSKAMGALTGAARLAHLMRLVDDEWRTPDGDEIDHAIHKHKWLNELSAGFYNRLFWPEAAVVAKRRKVSEPEAADLIRRSREHHAALQDYHKELRAWLKTEARPGLDTPYLLGMSMQRHKGAEVGAELFAWWARAKSLSFEGMIERESAPVRVHGYKIRAAMEWAKGLEKPGGIVWVHHQEMGQWAYEVFQAAGLPCVHAPAGDESNRTLLAANDPKADIANKFVIASITAHGTGKNLQAFHDQFFLQWARPAHISEQTVGRTHRNGQQADEVVVRTCLSTDFDRFNFAACMRDSFFLHLTQSPQKLWKGRHSPAPVLYSESLLRELGFDPKHLDDQQEAALKDRVGEG